MSINGTWYNELGSKMNLTSSGSSVWGTYQTAVGDASGVYELIGRLDSTPSGSTALGWAVAWNNPYVNAHSATSWSGQYQTIDGEEEVVALWLLTSETPPQEDWESTLVGKDIFKRNPFSDAETSKNRKRVSRSNP